MAPVALVAMQAAVKMEAMVKALGLEQVKALPHVNLAKQTEIFIPAVVLVAEMIRSRLAAWTGLELPIMVLVTHRQLTSLLIVPQILVLVVVAV